jgi:hypothetical protein
LIKWLPLPLSSCGHAPRQIQLQPKPKTTQINQVVQHHELKWFTLFQRQAPREEEIQLSTCSFTCTPSDPYYLSHIRMYLALNTDVSRYFSTRYICICVR